MGFSLSSLFDPAGITTGDSGDFFNNMLDPAGGVAQNFGWDMGALSDWHNQTGDYFDSLADFEMSQLSDWGQRLKNNPFKFAVAGTPLSTKVWNKALNKDWDPAINQWGGPAKETYQSAEEKGIDTSNSQGSHQVAQAIAAAYAGGYAGEVGGAAAGAGAESATAGAALEAGATGTEALAAADTVGSLASSVGSGAAAGGTVAAGNSLSAGSDNFWGDVGKGIASGGLGGLLGSGMDYAGAVGINDPQYKKLANNTVTGALKAKATNQDVGQGALYGFGNTALSQGGSMLGNMFNDEKKLTGSSMDYDPTAGGGFGGTATANQGETGYAPSAYTGSNNNMGMDSFKSLGGIAEGGAMPSSFNGGSSGGGSSGGSPVEALISAFMGGGGGSKAGGIGAYGDMASSLYGLYNANKQKKRMQEQAGQLNSLFSPNSPYAQQMRQRLDRKDAASGRRSQYGPREAQMMAHMAEMNSRNTPYLQQLNQGIGGMENMMARNGLNFAQQAYKAAPQMQQGYNSLMNLFNGGQ